MLTPSPNGARWPEPQPLANPGRFTSTATLTTPALNRRSLRWFGISACTANPEGRPPSLVEHASCWRSSTSSSLHFRTHVGCHKSVLDHGAHAEWMVSSRSPIPAHRRLSSMPQQEPTALTLVKPFQLAI